MKPLLPALTLVCACLALTRAAATPTASSSVPTAAADTQTWTLAGSEALPAAAEGLAHHRQTLEAANGAKATLHVLSFDASRYTFRVLDQEPAGQSSLEEILRRNHCLAGTNGGYFRPDFDPVGLLICDGRSVEPLTRSRLLTGVLVVTRNHHIALRRLNRPLHEKHAREALQSGPFLVENGHEVDGLNATHTAQRVAVCTDGWKRWGLVVSSDLTLAEFGAVLADPALLPGGLRINAALNLDGGHSTAMWSAQPGREPFYLHEGGSVRDFLGIAPREPAH
jgi:uncharacterized protein YigE (DUF2233 family)